MSLLKQLLLLVLAVTVFVGYSQASQTDYEKAQLECAKKAAAQTKVTYDEAYAECMKQKGFIRFIPI